MNTQLIRNIRDQLFFYCAIFLSLGILLGIVIQSVWIPTILLFFVFSSLFIKKDRSIFNCQLSIILFLSGWFISTIRINEINHHLNFIDMQHGQKVHFSGIIQQSTDTEYGWKGSCKILSLSKQDLLDPIHLTVYGKGKAPSEGDSLFSFGQIKKLNEKRNPGDFDFRSHFSRQGTFGRIFIDKEFKTVIIPGELPFLINGIRAVQNYVRRTLSSSTEPKTAGLLTALLLGDKSSIDENLKTDFANTGVIHVLAVSGLHVGYILIILTILTSILRIPWGWNRLVIILGLIGFCALTGGKPSVVRASMMAGLYVLTPIVDRPGNIWNIIGLTSFVLLAFDPLYISDLGFILSYSAVISIVYFFGLFEQILPEKIKPSQINNVVLKNVWSLFLVSLSAQIGTLPITAAYFHKIPIISLIANVIIVPIIGIIVVVGFIILGFSISPFLSEVSGNVAWVLQTIISWFAQFFSSFPFSSIPVSQIGIMDIFLYGIFVLGLFLMFQREFRMKGLITFLFLLNVQIWGNFSKLTTDIIFMDVGQGDAAFVRFSNGKTMLIDAGNRNRRENWGERVVIPVLNHFGIQKLDWTVMSHPHADHIGGLVSVVEEIHSDTLLDTYSGYGSWTYNHLIERYTEHETIIRNPSAGEILEITPMESLQFFAPDSAFSVNQHNVNNASIVFKLIVGENSFMFTGDLEHEGDDALTKFGDELKVDVLKVGHHGSITSTTQKILSQMRPELAVVSVGEGNKFSHPSPIVMDRLNQQQIKIHRTDHQGALWLKSDGSKYWKVPWK